MIVENKDRPGMVGWIGTLLAQAKINIAGMALSRGEAGGSALSIYNLDSMPSAELVREIEAGEGFSPCTWRSCRVRRSDMSILFGHASGEKFENNSETTAEEALRYLHRLNSPKSSLIMQLPSGIGLDFIALEDGFLEMGVLRCRPIESKRVRI